MPKSAVLIVPKEGTPSASIPNQKQHRGPSSQKTCQAPSISPIAQNPATAHPLQLS
jgi:hypothetical protein